MADFEWGEEKRRKTLVAHGIDFRDAVRVFRDDDRLWGFDAAHSDFEERWWTLGRYHDTILYIVTTVRGERIRIISARKAKPNERRSYYESLPHR